MWYEAKAPAQNVVPGPATSASPTGSETAGGAQQSLFWKAF